MGSDACQGSGHPRQMFVEGRVLIGEPAPHPGLVQVGPGVDLGRFTRLFPALAQEVRRYDDRLIVYYDQNVARYGIARLGALGLHFITLWQDDDGLPRPMDRRLIAALASWDLHPNRLEAPRTADEEARRREAADEARREKIERTFDDDIGHLTRANRRQLTRALARHHNLP